MRVVPARPAAYSTARGRIISNNSPEVAGNYLSNSVSAFVSGAWISANDPVAVPFALPEPLTVYQLGWGNGSAAGGGVDIGIYDLSWNRLVSAGAQTGTGNSVFQYINVTDTTLGPGRYWLAMSRDNTTANRVLFTNLAANLSITQFQGAFDSATDAYPLPNPLTNMALAATFTRIPVFNIVCRAL